MTMLIHVMTAIHAMAVIQQDRTAAYIIYTQRDSSVILDTSSPTL